MVSELAAIKSPDSHLSGIGQIGDFLEEQLGRAHRLRNMVELLGPVNTSRTLYARFAPNSVTDIVINNQPRLRFPLQLTTTPSDTANYRDIFGDNDYELPKEFDELIDGLPIVDMGAFIGISAAYFASRYQRSQILAVEPHYRNYSLLEVNAKPYNGQITPIFGAISPKRGIAMPSHPSGTDPHAYMGNIFSVNGQNGFPHQAQVDRSPTAILPEDIADRVEGSIGILKVDIEGAEKALFLSDGISELLRRTTVLMIETHDRFMSGCSQAVEAAVKHSRLKEIPLTPHTKTYVNKQARLTGNQ